MPDMAITYVDALPVKTPRSRIGGRQSKFAGILEELRKSGQPAKITTEPYDTALKAENAAARIRSGLVAGAEPGEFDAVHDEAGHVYAQHAGPDGIAAWAKRAEERRLSREANAAKKAGTNGGSATSTPAPAPAEAPAWQ